ncbi:MAG: hypothetical protein GY904_07790 [Planctomycetaceae bacterium]|nr:hypothetical protein [Planctomycetaceae bacterium]
MNPSLAIRDGRWALIADTNDAGRPKTHGMVRDDMARIKSSKPVEFLLFDLDQELSQRRDVAKEHPQVFERLRADAIRMHRDVVESGHRWDIPADYGAKNSRRIWDSY